jgi:hypothetical protein
LEEIKKGGELFNFKAKWGDGPKGCKSPIEVLKRII